MGSANADAFEAVKQGIDPHDFVIVCGSCIFCRFVIDDKKRAGKGCHSLSLSLGGGVRSYILARAKLDFEIPLVGRNYLQSRFLEGRGSIPRGGFGSF